ncbi:MAG: hypothetical protein R2733_09215 [Acidimicrobiales bacterium]
MSILSGLFATLLVALILSGADKLRRPAGAGRALLTARLVSGPPQRRFARAKWSARFLGLIEVAVGSAVAVVFLSTSVADTWRVVGSGGVAMLYLGFSWFLRRVESIDPGASCGCFGNASVTGPLHLVANLVAVAVSTVMALLVSLGADTSVLGDELAAGTRIVPLTAAIVVAALLFLLTPSLVTDLRRAQRPTTPTVPTFTIATPIQP